jgi:methionine sulfoxide reductase heme-binding subunit
MRGLSGYRIVAATAALVGALAGTILATRGATASALHLLLRATALTSLALFVGAFVASSVRALGPSRAGEWLVANRRYLGLSLATSHAAHLAAIVGAVRASADPPNPLVLAVGAVGYALLFAMAATSFDATAAWLGPRRWRTLHVVGMHYLWLVFALTYFGKAHRSAVALVAEMVLLGALALRLAVRVRARTARARALAASG